MMQMKLRFRVIATCLAAVLLLGVFPSGAVYADEGEGGEQAVQSDATDVLDMEAATPSQGDIVITSNTGEPTEEPAEEPAEEPDGEPAEEPAEEPSEELTEEPAEAPTEAPSEEPTEEPTEEPAAEINQDALFSWISAETGRLQSLYAGDTETIAALAEALGVDTDTMSAYVQELQAQNDAIVTALASDTDVFNSVLMANADEDSMTAFCETYGVEAIGVKLFNLKLDQMYEAMDQMEDPETALNQAAADQEALNALAQQLGVEPAVLYVVLLSYGIQPTAVSGDYVGFTYATPYLQLGKYNSSTGEYYYSTTAYGVIPKATYQQYVGGSNQNQIEALGTVAYCFNHDLVQPINWKDGFHPISRTNDKPTSSAISTSYYCYYDEYTDVSPEQFKESAQHESSSMSADDLYRHVMSIVINGYPYDRAGFYKNSTLSYTQFWALTQYAIWYYTDYTTLNFNTAYLTTEEARVFQELIETELTSEELQASGLTSRIDLYQSMGTNYPGTVTYDSYGYVNGGYYGASEMTFQDLLVVGLDAVTDPGSDNTSSSETEAAIPEAQAGQVVISKQVEGSGADTSKAFTFTLDLAYRSSSSATTGYYLSSSEISSLQVTTGTIRADGAKPTFNKSSLSTVSSGLAWSGSASSMTFTLKDGQYIILSGLPTNYAVYVEEESATDYTTTIGGTELPGTEKYATTSAAIDLNFVNTYAKAADTTRTLTLGKTATGASDSESQQFGFDIYLWKGDNSKVSGALTGTYGGVTFTQTTDTLPCQDGTNYYGYGTVTLKSGQTVDLSGLPDGYSYYIEEQNSQDYYVSHIEYSTPESGGEYESDTTNRYVWQKNVDFDGYVQFTNTYGPHSLRITKKILNVTDDERDDEFEFTVYLYKHGTSYNTALSSSSVTYSIETYGEDGAAAPSLGSTMTFTKTTTTLPGAGYGTYNVATFKLKHGQSVVIQGLPEDFGYYAVEKKTNKYGLYKFVWEKFYFDDGSEADTRTDRSFTEQYTYLDDSKIRASVEFVNANFDMSISKKLVNSSTTDDFTFKVYLTRYATDDGDDLEPVTGTFDLSYQNRTGSDVPQTVTFTDDDGTWSVGQVKVAAGQTVTIKGLPYTVNYKIVEATPADFTVEPTAYNGGVGYIQKGSNNNISGTAQLDQSTYGMVDDEELNVDVSTTFTNTYTETNGEIPESEPGKLVISKTVENTDKDETFTFTLDLAVRTQADTQTTVKANYLTSAQISALTVELGTIRADGEKPTFDKTTAKNITHSVWSGTATQFTFTLKNGQYLVFTGMPNNYNVYFAETGNNLSNYTTTFNGKEKTKGGYLVANGDTVSGTFVNTYVEPTTSNTCSLKISNTVKDDSGTSIPDVPFTYTITLKDDSGTPYTGTFDDMTFTNGTATFTLEDGDEKTISGMPEGYSYTIVQTVQSDYTATVDSPANATQSGTTTALTVTESGVTTPETEVKFLNVSKPTVTLSGNVLSIHKEVTGNVSNLDVVQNYEEFGFTVYLYAAYSSYSTPRAINTDNLVITGSSTIAGVEAPVTDNITFKTESYSNGYYTGYASVAAVYLTHGQTITISGLPSGCYYRVEETSCTSGGTSLSAYSTTVSGGSTNSSSSRYSSGAFSSTDGKVTVNFTNKRLTTPSTHKLTITKTVENGGAAQNQQDFYFRVRLCTSFNHADHSGGTYYEAKFTPMKDLKISGATIQSGVAAPALEDLASTTLSYSGYEASGTNSSTGSTYSYPCIGSVTDLSFTLKNGQAIVIDNLPDYYCYQVIETDANGANLENASFSAFSDDSYTSSVKVTQGSQNATYDTLAVGFNQLTYDHRVDYTNTYTAPATKDLTISKTVTGVLGDKTEAFTFDIALKNSSGTALTQQVTTSAGTTLTPTNGIYKVQLKHGESVTLKDLPEGTQYSITEEGAEAYQTTIDITDGTHYAQSGKTRSGALTGDASEIQVNVTNKNDVIITGIRTDTLPFLFLTAFAVGFLLLLMIGKRKARKEM
jgi:TQXA domain-containing protein